MAPRTQKKQTGGTATPRCKKCGRYIGDCEFENGCIESEFTPDSYYTTEKMEYSHVVCPSKKARKV